MCMVAVCCRTRRGGVHAWVISSLTFSAVHWVRGFLPFGAIDGKIEYTPHDEMLSVTSML